MRSLMKLFDAGIRQIGDKQYFQLTYLPSRCLGFRRPGIETSFTTSAPIICSKILMQSLSNLEVVTTNTSALSAE